MEFNALWLKEKFRKCQKSKQAYYIYFRDVFWQGTCDDGCYALADLLGWGVNRLSYCCHGSSACSDTGYQCMGCDFEP